MKDHGINPALGNSVRSVHVPNFAALRDVAVPKERLILFIAADAQDVSSEMIAQVAAHFLTEALVYICAWGPDCERVHDVFDEIWNGDGESERPTFMMSTWHSRDSLGGALWYLLECAEPADGQVETTVALAVTVGRREWMHTAEQALSDMPTFLAERVGEDDEE